MSVLTFNTQPITDTNAHFRAWGANVSTCFSTFGWTMASDAGNVDWTAVATPATFATVAGWEIWKMNDSLQATSPVYVKVEYGVGNTVNNPCMWITIGSNSNGSGVLSGILSVRWILDQANGANVCISYASGSNNRIAMALWCTGFSGRGDPPVSNTASGIMAYFAIERTKDSTGADTGEGVLFSFRGGGHGTPAFRQQYWNCLTGPMSVEDWGSLIASVNLTTNVASTGGAAPTAVNCVYPIYFHKGVFVNPGLNTVIYNSPSMVADAPINVSFYGATHKYMPIANTFGGTSTCARAGGNTSFAMRYE